MIEENKNDKSKPKYMRLTDETKALFDQIVDKLDSNPDTVLNNLINVYELEVNKNIIKDRESEFNNITYHLGAIAEAFNFLTNYNADTENRVRKENANRITADANTITELRNKIETLNSHIEANQQVIDTLRLGYEEKMNEVMALQNQLKKSEELSNQYKEQNDMLNSLLVDYKEDREKNKDLKNQIDLKDTVISTKDKKITELEQENKMKILDLREQHNTSIEKLRSEHNKISEELRTKYNAKLEESNLTYKNVLQELEQVRKENYQLKEQSLKKSKTVKPLESDKTVPKEKDTSKKK